MSMKKCMYCGKSIDTSIEKFQQVSPRRVAHLDCNNFVDRMIATRDTILDFSLSLLGENVNLGRLNAQITQFLKKGLTYQGIYLTLKYWYQIKRNDVDKANGGIGIVPYVYDDAKKYWNSVEPSRIPKISEEYVTISPKKRRKIKIGEE